MPVVREIALKKDESLLVTWMAEPARYARLQTAAANYSKYVFALNIPHIVSGIEYTQVEIKFDDVPYYATNYEVTGISATGARRFFRGIGRSFWGGRTIKGLLVWELPQFGAGYDIVDWGGIAVPDDRPA
ncbi:hypothetical protein ACFXHA_45145 [Nocardia sp. NPDC059240]|uniref:hypothetical protein n=1 Tax=Nocardia sp. NPDC059240 TaxID=3346786 RepID=UPI003689D4DE